MPTPEFVLKLRERIGHDLLFMTGVSGVVLDARGRVLLGRRADVDRWTLPSGILEPGEQPAAALLREIEEETAIRARVLGLSSVWAGDPGRYPNGDQVQFVDLCFRCERVSGDPWPTDGELSEVAWFGVEALPAGLTPTSRQRLTWGLAFEGTTWFQREEDPIVAPAAPEVS